MALIYSIEVISKPVIDSLLKKYSQSDLLVNQVTFISELDYLNVLKNLIEKGSFSSMNWVIKAYLSFPYNNYLDDNDIASQFQDRVFRTLLAIGSIENQVLVNYIKEELIDTERLLRGELLTVEDLSFEEVESRIVEKPSISEVYDDTIAKSHFIKEKQLINMLYICLSKGGLENDGADFKTIENWLTTHNQRDQILILYELGFIDCLAEKWVWDKDEQGITEIHSRLAELLCKTFINAKKQTVVRELNKLLVPNTSHYSKTKQQEIRKKILDNLNIKQIKK